MRIFQIKVFLYLSVISLQCNSTFAMRSVVKSSASCVMVPARKITTLQVVVGAAAVGLVYNVVKKDRAMVAEFEQMRIKRQEAEEAFYQEKENAKRLEQEQIKRAETDQMHQCKHLIANIFKPDEVVDLQNVTSLINNHQHFKGKGKEYKDAVGLQLFRCGVLQGFRPDEFKKIVGR